MSEAAGRDVRKLAAVFNARRAEVADRIIDPNTKVKECDAQGAADSAVSIGESFPVAQ